MFGTVTNTGAMNERVKCVKLILSVCDISTRNKNQKRVTGSGIQWLSGQKVATKQYSWKEFIGILTEQRNGTKKGRQNQRRRP